MSIPTEDNYIEWILSNIKDYFRLLDYKVLTFSIGQVKEKFCPVDRILAVGNKIVGIQFKRPLKESLHPRIRLTTHQHRMIGKSGWIFYCLPDFTDLRMQRVALYHCRFFRAEDIEDGRVNLYYRWGKFAEGVISCWFGFEITEGRVEDFFRQISESPVDVYISLNKKTEEVYLLRRNAQLSLDLETEPA